MANALQLPKDLYQARDAVIENVHKGLEPPASLGLIQEWLEHDGWDVLTGSAANETIAVDINQFASHSFNDKEYVMSWLGEGKSITNQMRIAHARMLIKDASNGDDGYLAPSVYSVNIQSANEKSAVLAAVIRIMGQGGPEISWWGVYKTHIDFLDVLKKSDLIPVEYIKNLTDAEILSYWKK